MNKRHIHRLNFPKRPKAKTPWLLLFFAPLVLLSCSFWTPASPARAGTLPTALSALPVPTAAAPTQEPPRSQPQPSPLSPSPSAAARVPTNTPALSYASGEPAGCLSLAEQQALNTTQASLSRADQLLGLPKPLAKRILDKNWNAYTQTFSRSQGDVLSLSVDDVQARYLVQSMLNALQVTGYVTWLRRTPEQGLHILAVPVREGSRLGAAWAPYLQAYWQGRDSLPSADHSVIQTLKIPPCRWMGQYGLPSAVDSSWWPADPAARPDYATAALPYLADTNEAAVQVAGRIDWLGKDGTEGPNTMCGPLVWAIMHDAGALPPDWGGWAEGAKAFWLAMPRINGRPWSLFPPGSYHVYSSHQPLSKFDFSKFTLYPGDFLYTYSEGSGFDHMLVVTDVDSAGNVYTVTNKIQAVPVKKTTIERLLLLSLTDPLVGIARNQWANDRRNGRTGHNGFDVFRWAWMEKDIQNQPAQVTVQPGDTLELVALRWKTPAEQIARYNGITMDASLSVGQALQIPPNEVAGVR